MLTLLLLQAAAAANPAVTGPAPADPRDAACLQRTIEDPAAARVEAEAYRLAGGGWRARRCLAAAEAREARFPAAAAAFEAAARDAELAKAAPEAATLWAQAGNGWLAAGEPLKARAALDAALASGALTGLALGEAHLDRARALVAAGQPTPARADLDQATIHAAADPLAWLLSATLARRQGDLPRAHKDIGEALDRAADDANVQLEAGNIALLQNDHEVTKASWSAAVRLAPGQPAGVAARAALAQFGITPPPPPEPGR